MHAEADWGGERCLVKADFARAELPLSPSFLSLSLLPPTPPPHHHMMTASQTGIDKLIRILEGEENEPQFNAEQYMRLYT